jgi:hypothetical protein
MKKFLIICLMVFTLGLTACNTTSAPVEKTMKVTTIDRNRDMVTCVDAEEQVWQFFGAEDYLVGDLVRCEIDDRGTLEFSDDIILNHHWLGVSF